mgnify:CR=1 FL=1|tara:strand:- start:333 stop:518 length:186 start_codon:yes stop_codon:yes gene_type:complete
MSRNIVFGAVFGIFAIAALTFTQGAPVEVGNVDWSRDLDGALEKADQSGKPVLLLFQEVPG